MNEITAAGTGIRFGRQFYGYSKVQVDGYIRGLAEEYRAAYGKYSAIRDEHEKAFEELKRLEERERNRPNVEAISKALLQSEVLARHIIEDARVQAKKIIGDTNAEVNRIKEDARAMTENANAEVEAAEEKARRIIEEAGIERLKHENRAKKKIEAANETITRAIKEMQELLEIREARGERRPNLSYLIPYGSVNVGS